MTADRPRCKGLSMNAHKHKVFLGSSSESKWLAREVEGALQGFDNVEVDAWFHFGSWSLGAPALETLESRLRECDFAILVLAGDDWLQSRGAAARPAPRDNVIFELGLFMGRLGRDRAFFFFPPSAEFKMPSDLFGITALPYNIEDRSKAQSIVSPACTQIVKQMDLVARQHRAKGMQARPRLQLNVRFPEDHGCTADGLNHLSADCDSVLKLRLRITDDCIEKLRVYYHPRLNLRKSAWTYGEDQRGRFFWPSDLQLDEMKTTGGFLSFDVSQPQRGSHEVSVVAFAKEQALYEKKFIVNVD